MLGHTLFRLVLVAFVWSLVSPAGVARADEVTAGLTQASKLMQQGAHVKAIDVITNVLASGKAQADMAAKALLMRGQANEKLGKQAFALADYNQALWMQGLSETDKKQAEEGRARIQGGLGVKESSDIAVSETSGADASPPAEPLPQASAPAPAAAPRQVRTASSGGVQPSMGFDQSPPKQEAQSSSSGGGIGGFFTSLFGSTETPKAEPEQHAVVAVVRPEQMAPAPQRSRTVRAPDTTASASPWPAQSAQATPSSASAAGGTSVGFSIQFAALVSEDRAIYEVNRVAKKFGADLEGRMPSVLIVGTKEGDTLYKIVAGPYATKAESTAKCDELKTKGAQCMVISVK